MAEKFEPLRDLHEALSQEVACASHPAIKRSASPEEAELWWETVQHCAPHRRIEHLRWLSLNDLYFFIVYVLNNYVVGGRWSKDGERDPRSAKWFFERANEVQDAPDGYCDLWSRGGGKTSIVTHGLTIQDLLHDPEQTFCILSHTRPQAKAFMGQIKIELEQNELLKELFPDVLYQDPTKEAVKWSLDDGIIVKRKGNPKEPTIAAYGLTDGMPTGGHYSKLLYEDVVTERSVTTPEMMEKTTKSLELSVNLAATRPAKFRMAGTPYAEGDTYSVMIERGFAKARIRPAIIGNVSYLWDDAGVAQLKQTMSPRMFALQILIDPKQADEERGFKKEWLVHWKKLPAVASLNIYIIVDPGGKHRTSTSYTAMAVIGLGADKHIRVIDGLKDRFSLVQRGDALFAFLRKYPKTLRVLYERFSMQADVEYLRDRMDRENFRFPLDEVGADGNLGKDQRIEKLQPEFMNGRILLPPIGEIERTRSDGKKYDLIEDFIRTEYLPFPYSAQKDFLDALSRIKDGNVNLIYPRPYGGTEANLVLYDATHAGGSWMGS